MSKYKKLITIPIVIIILCVYLIGLNILNRFDRVDEVKDAVPASNSATDTTYKSEELENEELQNINDKININTATASELILLDGIGETVAQRIIDKRKELGGFSSIEDIRLVQGIGDKTFESIKNYITAE